MVDAKNRAAAAALVLISLVFAGCFGGDGPSSSQTATGSPSPTSPAPTSPSPLVVALTITKMPSSVNVSTPFDVEYSVAIQGDASARIASTSIRYGNTSVASPTRATDYPFKAGEETDAVPGAFNASLTVPWSGTIRLRAHAEVAGHHYFSAERSVVMVVPPPRVLMDNATFFYNATGNSDDRSMTVLERGAKLEIRIEQYTVQEDVPATLQPEPSQDAANVTFFGPGNFVHNVTLESLEPQTPDEADVKVETYDSVVLDPAPGSWTVRAYGIGTNVVLKVRVVEKFG